ncbi:MAG: ASCH domain-containing protein [Steroidobacteraceae bacterium]
MNLCHTRPMHLPEGPRRPGEDRLEQFFLRACANCPSLDPRAGYQVRWIGLDAPTTLQVFERIRSGDKCGTFALPWIQSRTGQPEPRSGDQLVLIDFDGRPTLLVVLTEIYQQRFGSVTERDTAIDGEPVRQLGTWIPLHTWYWNRQLHRFGLSVTPDMPFWVQKFELVFDVDRSGK